MDNFICHMPTKIFFGKRQIIKLGDEVRKYGKRILLIYGGGSIKRIGLYDDILDQFKKVGVDIFELGGVKPNPRLSMVHRGAEICREKDIDFILAAGGGSTIDCAKAIAAQALYEGDIWDYFIARGKKTVEDAIPLGVILTIAATGSEMNGNSVITNLPIKEKLYISSSSLVPKFSILDPEYTFSVPVDQTRNGIVDIIVHVVDQYFDKTPNTPLQDRFAEEIITTMVEIADTVLNEPFNYDARATMMWCGTWALNYMIGYGKQQDWAGHDMEHEVSGVYDIAHAVGLAIISPNWATYILSEGTDKFVQFATRVWDVKTDGKTDRDIALEGIEKYREFFVSIGMPSSFKEINIDDKYFKLMAKKATRFGPIGGYKKLTAEDVLEIYKMCLD